MKWTGIVPQSFGHFALPGTNFQRKLSSFLSTQISEAENNAPNYLYIISPWNPFCYALWKKIYNVERQTSSQFFQVDVYSYYQCE